jgi:hypothetical protein
LTEIKPADPTCRAGEDEGRGATADVIGGYTGQLRLARASPALGAERGHLAAGEEVVAVDREV